LDLLAASTPAFLWISNGVVVELAQYLISRGYNLHTIYDEIGILEGDDRRPEYVADRRGLDWVDLIKSYVPE
jgi:hypothetical protein